MVQVIGREVHDTLHNYVEGDSVSFYMHAHIAVALA